MCVVSFRDCIVGTLSNPGTGGAGESMRFYGLLFEIEHVTRTYHEKIRFLRRACTYLRAIADSNRKTGEFLGRKTRDYGARSGVSTSFLS